MFRERVDSPFCPKTSSSRVKNALNSNFSSSTSRSTPSSGRNAYIDKVFTSNTESSCVPLSESLKICIGSSVKLEISPVIGAFYKICAKKRIICCFGKYSEDSSNRTLLQCSIITADSNFNHRSRSRFKLVMIGSTDGIKANCHS